MYLNCKTYFSFKYGVFSTEQLVKQAVEVGALALALTNINCTADHWEFLSLCKEQGIKPVLGAEIRNDSELFYLVLARNDQGVKRLNAFLSHYLQAGEPFPEHCSLTEDVWIIYPLSKAGLATAPHERIGIKPGEVNRLFNNVIPLDRCIVCHPVTFKDKKGHNLHRLLRAIDKNILLSKQSTKDVALATETFVTPVQVLNAFAQYPQIITNTLQLIDSCGYEMQLESDKNKKTFSASAEDDRILLEKLAVEGMYERFGKDNKEAHQRVYKELAIIHQLGFNAYFLITWDIIRYAQSRGFYYVGRGSGANSIVAYCLRITDVNPIDLDLYFERFLNPYRTSPPDFDIDFSWKDRDEVIDYVFKRYGRDHVALLGMYSTFQFNATIRELGKVFGLPKAEIDALVNNRKATFREDAIQKHILYYGALMQDMPNYLSIHPGGMLISEEPITQYAAVELPPKGFVTAQIDMFVAEKVGMYKLDILSQRGVGHIKEAIRLIKENRSISVDIHQIEQFKKDEQVAEQIRRADTIGCFYIESPAMRQLLRKLRCSDYLTLVAASSIIRPGVAQSGMMREYISRFHNPNSFQYLHPKMKELLEETYGVMVYQEDVIKVAHHFAGLDMGEADVLRRAMSGKYRGGSGFERIKGRFFENCKERGYPEAITQEVWRQIESFGGYSFSKAHSASFAVESYQSLFLKTYYPMEFMVAVINNFGGFYSTELYFHELKRCGATVHLPCLNHSEELTCIRGSEVYIGLIHLQGLEKASIEVIMNARRKSGLFLHLQDVVERTALGIEQLTILIRIGALRFTGKDKKQLLWEAHFLQKKSKQSSDAGTLFQEPIKSFTLPRFEIDPMEDVLDEIELLGFPLGNVFDLVKKEDCPYILSRDFQLYTGKVVEVLGYYVTQKPVRTVKGEYMYFGTFLDASGEWIDTVHFPDSADKYPITGRGLYHLKGKVVEEFGVYSVEVKSLSKYGLKIKV